MTKEQKEKKINQEGKLSMFDELYDLVTYPRPEGDIDLFYHSKKRQREVIIGGKDIDWGIYCIGYRRAANVLVNHITQKHVKSVRRDYSRYWESPVYAIVFLYRHYLELRLKELILAYGGSFKKVSNEHTLLNLWIELRKLDNTNPDALDNETVKDIEVAEKIIVQFDKIDRKSEVFRYPVSRAGLITVSPIQFDLVRLKEFMGWIGHLLDGWSSGVYAYQQAQSLSSEPG